MICRQQYLCVCVMSGRVCWFLVGMSAAAGYGSPHVYRGGSGGSNERPVYGTTVAFNKGGSRGSNLSTPMRVVRTSKTPPTQIVQLASDDFSRNHQRHRSPSPEEDPIDESVSDVMGRGSRRGSETRTPPQRQTTLRSVNHQLPEEDDDEEYSVGSSDFEDPTPQGSLVPQVAEGARVAVAAALQQHGLAQSREETQKLQRQSAVQVLSPTHEASQQVPAPPTQCVAQPKHKAPKVNIGNKELIGSGSFGNVYKALDMDTMRTVAVKEVQLITDESRELKKQIHALEREIRVMQKLDHPHIVKYLGATRDGSKLLIFMEYIGGGTIASYIRQYGLAPQQAAFFTKQVVSGLAYLHSKNIAHRDLKGDNLFVDTLGRVKVGDFGTSKELQTIRMTNSVAGTPYFMAPEVVTCQGHGIEADVWSVGCCVIQMLTGKPPFHQYDNPYTVMFQVSKGNIEDQIPANFPPEAADFVRKCTALQPGDRWTCQQLLEHPWIAQIPTTTSSTNNSEHAPDATAATSTPPQQSLPPQGLATPPRNVANTIADPPQKPTTPTEPARHEASSRGDSGQPRSKVPVGSQRVGGKVSAKQSRVSKR